MSKKNKIFKEKFSKFMSIFIILLLLGGVLIPAIIVIVEMFAGG
jgi:hypothetical protein